MWLRTEHWPPKRDLDKRHLPPPAHPSLSPAQREEAITLLQQPEMSIRTVPNPGNIEGDDPSASQAGGYRAADEPEVVVRAEGRGLSPVGRGDVAPAGRQALRRHPGVAPTPSQAAQVCIRQNEPTLIYVSIGSSYWCCSDGTDEAMISRQCSSTLLLLMGSSIKSSRSLSRFLAAFPLASSHNGIQGLLVDAKQANTSYWESVSVI